MSKSGCEHIKTVTLELGGKSPVVVFDDGVDIDFLVEWLMVCMHGVDLQLIDFNVHLPPKILLLPLPKKVGIFYNSGQVCSATSRLIVQSSMKDRLLSALVEKTKELRLGAGYGEGTTMGPLIAKRQQDR